MELPKSYHLNLADGNTKSLRLSSSFSHFRRLL
jgi:hypothetical protein